jgi:hypothetical protein
VASRARYAFPDIDLIHYYEEEVHSYGFQMILYPTTILFQVTRAIERALIALKDGKPMTAGVNLDTFEEIVGMPGWQDVVKKFHPG